MTYSRAPDAPNGRRAFLAGTGLAGISLLAPNPARAGQTDRFEYEIVRTEAEWRARLDPDEYRILRRGGTELPASSILWDENRDGVYCCKGCDLRLYTAAWKVPVPKGWAFFRHAEPDTVLTDIDGPVAEYGMDVNTDTTLIEAHCRRCGSHLGHILIVNGGMLHCINGASLEFSPA
jgi:peptide-methionine (R)-S-oxide reductase